MAALLSAIEQANQQEQLKQFAANEAAIAARFAFTNPPLNSGDKESLEPFVKWCSENKVRHCPAKPVVLATFISDIAVKWPLETLLSLLRALERLHDAHAMANPVQTATVRVTLEPLITDAPRSWTKQEKIEFAFLPADIRAAVLRRDKDREMVVRKAQNEAATARNELAELRKRQPDSAVSEPVTNGETKMAYTKGGDQSTHGDKDVKANREGLRTQQPYESRPENRSRDVSSKILTNDPRPAPISD